MGDCAFPFYLAALAGCCLGFALGYIVGKADGRTYGQSVAESKYKPCRDPIAVIREEETGCFSTRIGEEDGDGINVLFEAAEKDMPWDRKLAVARVKSIMPSAQIVHESDPAPPDEEPTKRPPVKQPPVAAVAQAVKIMGETTGFLTPYRAKILAEAKTAETGHPWVVHEFGDGTRAVMDIEESARLDREGTA